MTDTFFYPNVDESLPRKILFLGDEGIGKTTFIRTFCDHMRDFYQCDTYRGTFLVFTQFLFYHLKDGKRIPIQFLDLPAGTTAESRLDQYPAKVDMVVLCFAVDDPVSFGNVRGTWLREVMRYYPIDTRIYLLGLRNDLREHNDLVAVMVLTAQRIHDDHGFAGEYMECSARENSEQAVSLMNTLIGEIFFEEQEDEDVEP